MSKIMKDENEWDQIEDADNVEGLNDNRRDN